MKTFIHTLSLVIVAAFIVGCPPKHEEPLNGSLVTISKSEHLVMGNPSGAVDSVSFTNNYLMEKSHYVVSYNRDRGISNWVAWWQCRTLVNYVALPNVEVCVEVSKWRMAVPRIHTIQLKRNESVI